MKGVGVFAVQDSPNLIIFTFNFVLLVRYMSSNISY